MTIERLLDPGERLVWSGRPDALRYAVRKGTATGLFGLLWTLGTSYGMSLTISRPSVMGLAFMSVFVGAGVVLLLSPLWHLWRASNTSYAITTKRAIVDTSGPFAYRLSVPLTRVQFTALHLSSGGVGDIIFKEAAVLGGEQPALKREGFVAVPDAVEVERIFRRELGRAT